ncbi:MAG: acyl-CoA dehydrogenase family protein [Candidatus Krumholzibacteria bacterium]|jgi:alkylation response protein AidB-like acyl-CoA dehydrogenase|nr:acyl-CoA dehydrogenase family protein [Candidatus Krumholzibacteria bacterium]
MTRLAGLAPEMTEMVVQTLRQVVQRELPDARVLELDSADLFPHDLIQKLLSPDVGLHLIFLPESAGGLGGGARDICRVSEEMAAVDLGVATAFLAICLGTDPILVGGTDEQKATWLPRIAQGLVVAYAVTEPEAGSNVAALKTVAEPITAPDGSVTAYRLNGAKQWITNGGVADLYTVLAKTPGGPSFFILEKGTPGLSAGKKEEKHGIRASNTASVILEDVVVPAANLVSGVEGEGLKQANEVFGYTRLMVGAFGLGGGQGALDRALRYGRERIQFGAPLVEKQGYLLKLVAPHWIDLCAGRAYVDAIARRIDAGERGLQVEGSVAKLWCTEAGNRAADAAIQALGGYGYSREYMVEKIRRDVRITSIYEGTSEIQQNIIGLYRWKETVRSKGGFYEALAGACDEIQQGQPACGADLAAAALRGLNTIILDAHETKNVRHQFVQFELADAISRTEVAAAMADKAARSVDAGDAAAALLTATSRVFARQALQAVAGLAHPIVCGFAAAGDAASEQRARAVADRITAAVPPGALSGLWTDLALVGDLLKRGA